MKPFTHNSTLKHSWDQVATTFWQRYPNPHSKHILSEDTVCRWMRNGLLYSKRLILKTNRMPKWAEHFTTLRHVPVVEDSIIDRLNRTLSTYTRNIGSTSTRILCVEEKVTYSQSPDSNSHTLVQRQAWFTSGLRGFSSMIQRCAIERYRHNASQANKGLMYVLKSRFPQPEPQSKREMVTDAIRQTVQQQLTPHKL